MEYKVIVFYYDPLKAGEAGGLVRFSEDTYDSYELAYVRYNECIELIENSVHEGKTYKVVLFGDDGLLLIANEVTPCYEAVPSPDPDGLPF